MKLTVEIEGDDLELMSSYDALRRATLSIDETLTVDDFSQMNALETVLSEKLYKAFLEQGQN